jgi:hypothetical protein
VTCCCEVEVSEDSEPKYGGFHYAWVVAAVTFLVLLVTAEVGQVVYLTHHQHLCEIAERVCPSVQIYDLESIRASRNEGAEQ